MVVESTSVASEIISRLNRKYAGRLTFIPLNDIENYDTCFEDTDDAVSLVRKLEFDPKYAKAFNQVRTGTPSHPQALTDLRAGFRKVYCMPKS